MLSPPVDLAPKLAGGFGVCVDVMFFTFAIPAAITAAAPIKPNRPPCASALLAPAKVSCIACTTAMAFPNLEFCPTIPAMLPSVCFSWFSFATAKSFSSFVCAFALFFKNKSNSCCASC